ncbi:MAG: AMP-binding protein [Chromatiales bacterium]|nr:AMP-binding protein [Chromatiales bacterium]
MHTFIDPLNRALQVAPQATAFICGDVQVSYAEFAERCRALGGMLAAHGARPGDRIAILAANSHRYMEVYVGVPAAGYVIVPLNTRHAEPELRYALEDGGVRVLICDRDPGALADVVETVIMMPEEYEVGLAGATPITLGQGIDENTLAGLFYTGGTTGASKGVMLSHRNLIANSQNYMVLAPSQLHETHLYIAPLFHAAGSNNILGTIWAGQCGVIQPAFEPDAALDLIERYRITSTLGVPAMIAAMTEAQIARPRDVSSLVFMAHGGSPIATEVVRRAVGAFPNAEFCHLYGATELSPLATGLMGEQHLLESERGRSCGQPIIGTEIRMMDADGNEMPRGEVGELAVRGTNVMQGYWNKPEQTAAALRGGWYYSGDLGFMDEDGYVMLVDRAKDMIVSGGENVYGSEVEEALYLHPAVLEAAVFGVPDEHWGEAVHAVVVLRNEVSAEELIGFCREKIAGYKVPKGITFQTDALPKSGPGKVLKRELRRPFWEGRERQIG